jgi:putative sigma-54 modulation protein
MGHPERIIKINITFRNTEATDALRAYAEEKLTHCLNKFVHRDTDVHAILKVERNRQIAEVNFRSDGNEFNGTEESDSMYTAIDQLVGSLSQQLRKHKEKITAHH